MDSNNNEAPPVKKPKLHNDYKLCIKCQATTKDSISHQPKESSFIRFISCVHQRARFGEQEFIPIQESSLAYKLLCRILTALVDVMIKSHLKTTPLGY